VRTMQLELTAAFTGPGVLGTSLVVSPNWISNGHWAVNRDSVAPYSWNNWARKLTAEEAGLTFAEKPDDSVFDNKIIDAALGEPLKPWIYSGAVVVTGVTVALIYEGPNEGLCGFNRAYIDGLGLRGAPLYGTGPRTAFFAAPHPRNSWVMLMAQQLHDADIPVPESELTVEGAT